MINDVYEADSTTSVNKFFCRFETGRWGCGVKEGGEVDNWDCGRGIGCHVGSFVVGLFLSGKKYRDCRWLLK